MAKRAEQFGPYREGFGKRLEQLRKQTRLSQEEVARLVRAGGVPMSRSYPSTLERGRNRPAPEMLDAIMRVLRAYGASVDEDELRYLANFAPPPARGMIPVDDPAKESVLRALARLSAEQLRRLWRISGEFGHEVYDIETGKPIADEGRTPRCDRAGEPGSEPA